MSVSNQEILQWISEGGLQDLVTGQDDQTKEIAAASPYAIDTMTGMSLADIGLMIVDELRGIKEELREMK